MYYSHNYILIYMIIYIMLKKNRVIRILKLKYWLVYYARRAITSGTSAVYYLFFNCNSGYRSTAAEMQMDFS
jgi:hypothetical protein